MLDLDRTGVPWLVHPTTAAATRLSVGLGHVAFGLSVGLGHVTTRLSVGLGYVAFGLSVGLGHACGLSVGRGHITFGLRIVPWNHDLSVLSPVRASGGVRI
ncbi:MAG: hypothetical protein H0W81_11790 [Chloroflexi bacterium]|nr:hypothetical protein [Chloroflexota bacterium]